MFYSFYFIFQLLLSHPDTDLETLDSYSKTLERMAEERGHADILNVIVEEKMRRFAQDRVRAGGGQPQPQPDLEQRIRSLEEEVKVAREILDQRLEMKRDLEAKFGEFERMEQEIMELKAKISGNRSCLIMMFFWIHVTLQTFPQTWTAIPSC